MAWEMRLAVLAVMTACSACAASPTRVCTPGTTLACLCADGRSGAQSCRDDGSGYAACACAGSSDAGAHADGPADAGAVMDLGSGTDATGVDIGIDAGEASDAASGGDGAAGADAGPACSSGVLVGHNCYDAIFDDGLHGATCAAGWGNAWWSDSAGMSEAEAALAALGVTAAGTDLVQVGTMWVWADHRSIVPVLTWATPPTAADHGAWLQTDGMHASYRTFVMYILCQQAP